MRVLVASEAHFTRGHDAWVYARGGENYGFWSGYLAGCAEVGVLARLREPGESLEQIDGAEGPRRADGPGVHFHGLEDYLGPWQYLRCRAALRREVRAAVAKYDAVILRAPGAVAYLVWQATRDLRKPYAVEVLGDPWEALAPERASSPSLLRPMARRWSRRSLERLCREAPLACYVTRQRLQERYPAKGKSFACSDVRLRSLAGQAEMEARIKRIAEASAGLRIWELGFAGSLEQLYKAPDIHLRAIRICLDQGLPIRFSVLGDGRYRPMLERMAASLGLAGAVQFLGAAPQGRAVDEFLQRLDLFLLASRTEGLPRALVEAMAHGCPAIGSTAGGIPELLAAQDLVAAGSATRLAEKIGEVLENPARLRAMARRNRAAAAAYAPERLNPLRAGFLAELAALAGHSQALSAPAVETDLTPPWLEQRLLEQRAGRPVAQLTGID